MRQPDQRRQHRSGRSRVAASPPVPGCRSSPRRNPAAPPSVRFRQYRVPTSPALGLGSGRKGCRCFCLIGHVRSKNLRPPSVPTITLVARPTNKPVSTTPVIAFKRACNPAGSAIPGIDIQDRVPPIRSERLAPCHPKLNVCPPGPNPCCRRLPAERNHLHRKSDTMPQLRHELPPSTMTIIRLLAVATIFSRSKAPPNPLIRSSGWRGHLVGPVDRQVDRRML